MFRGLHTQNGLTPAFVPFSWTELMGGQGSNTPDELPNQSTSEADVALNKPFSSFQGIRLNENARTGRGSLPPPDFVRLAREPCTKDTHLAEEEAYQIELKEDGIS
ncbi:MAG: hypothetical protein ACM3QZ_14835 [Solirubrobacterales bacterium]